MQHFPIEYDPQSEQYYVIDTRTDASDRFAGQFDTIDEAKELQAKLVAE